MKTSNSVTLIKDSKLANDAGKDRRLVILGQIDTAEDLLGNALLHGLRMTAEHGQTSPDEVAQGYTRCGSPKVYASWFNRGAKAAAIIGITKTLELIDKAGAGVGGFARARDALGSITSQAADSGSKTLAGKAATQAVKVAFKASTDKCAERKGAKASKAPAVKGARVQNAGTLAAAALECGKGAREMAAFVKLASNAASRMPETPERADLHRKACAALASACEIWSLLAK